MNEEIKNQFSDIGKQKRQANCEKHGDFESRHLIGSVWTHCPICAEEAAEERRKFEEEKQAQEEKAALESRIGRSGVPERFKNKKLSEYFAVTDGQKHAYEFAKLFADEFDTVSKTGRSAIFCGKPGTGKTHLAIGIGLQIMEKRYSVQFTTVQRAIRRIKDAWRKDSEESETDVIDLFARPSLLIVDEIGVQFGTDFEKNAIFDILNERYENRKPTILLSNLTPQEVKAFLGERVYDRLREDGGKCIAFDWESYRGKQ